MEPAACSKLKMWPAGIAAYRYKDETENADPAGWRVMGITDLHP